MVVNEIGNETRAYATNAKLVAAGALSLLARNENDIRTIGASLGASEKLTISGVGAGNITQWAAALPAELLKLQAGQKAKPGGAA